MKNRFTLIVILALAVGVTALPGGIGSVGRVGDTGGGDGNVAATFNPECAIDPNAGQLATGVRDALVDAINDPNGPCDGFMAVAQGSTDFEVLRDSGSDLDRLRVCETDSGITRVRSEFTNGRMKGRLGRVKQVPAGHPDGLRVIVECQGPLFFDDTFDTTVPPNDTIAGLNASVESALISAGLEVEGNNDELWVFCPGSRVEAVEIIAQDTGIEDLCVEVMGKTGSVPALSRVGMFLLVILLTGIAIVMLRRGEVARR